MDEHVYSKDKSLHDRIKRSSHLTFANAPANKTTGEDLKVKQGEMESRILAAMVNLVDVRSDTIQCQWDIQEDSEKQASPEADTTAA